MRRVDEQDTHETIVSRRELLSPSFGEVMCAVAALIERDILL
jgi:hypothetical protein